MRLLIVEDDPGIAQGVALSLKSEGYATELAASVQQAWSLLRLVHFDAVLLDLGLPDADGTLLLARVRRSAPGGLPDPQTPVLIMTARDEMQQRVEGLDAGADDFLSKPFDVRELRARLRAALRRSAGRASSRQRLGEVEVDFATCCVTRAGQPVELAPRHFQLLELLLQSQGKVLTKSAIEERLYSADEAVESNALQVHVHHLRRKLGADLIQTVRGVGYFIPRIPEGQA